MGVHHRVVIQLLMVMGFMEPQLCMSDVVCVVLMSIYIEVGLFQQPPNGIILFFIMLITNSRPAVKQLK